MPALNNETNNQLRRLKLNYLIKVKELKDKTR